MSGAPAISVRDVTVRFGSHVAVDSVSATIPAGSFTAVIGPNGCGKSTLLRALCQLRPADEGSIAVQGRPVGDYPRRELARTVSLLPQQTVAPPGLTVTELVARGRHPYHSLLRTSAAGDQEAIDRAVERAGVGHLLQRRVSELSGGQRQRVWLAMVLAQDTPIVLLDEPTTYLDLAAQYQLLDVCADLVDHGRTVVAVLHDLPQAVAYAGHLLLMKQGRLVADGRPPEVVTEQHVADVYGISCRVDLDDPRGPVVAPRSRHERRDALPQS
ncbi:MULTISPECIES: ABC transporter ATP-binding protein [unclassified Luteococcus]|uniref:ABC transporter ATP-binding protein n=1 Tax=unclassified Luteococcus TaxID=2639923 RepID=UPI00313A8761